MEINKLTSSQTAGIEKKNQSLKVKNKGLRQDTFKKEVEEFNPAEAEVFLSELKNSYGSQKFPSESARKNIIKEVKKQPEKWEYIKDLAPRENISGFNVPEFAKRPVEDLKVAVDFASMKDHEDNPKFQSVHIVRVLDFKPEEQLNAKVLSKTRLSSDNILKAAQEKDLNCKKLAKKTDEMVDLIGKDNLKDISFARDAYSKGDYTIIAKDKRNGNITKEILDGKLKRYALETIEEYHSKGTKYKIQKSTDLRNNTTSKIRYECDNKGFETVTNEIRIVKDKNGNLKRTEYSQPSEIKGILDIKYVYPNGKTEQISSGKIDKKTGIMSIKKNMTSVSGIKTEYLFEDDPNGNRISDYKIIDKKGKILLQNSESFEVLDKNHFISSKNNQKYEIIADDLSKSASKYTVTVKDLNNPKKVVTFETNKEITGDYKAMIEVLKKMPGEELFKLKENTTKLFGIKDILDAYSLTDKSTREIHAGDDLFVILHELGHAVDMKDVDMMKEKETIHKAIFEDEKFNKIYEKEKAAFNKAYPDAQRNHIAYFIDHETHYQGKIGGRKETIAEANALLTTPKTHEVLAMRSQYLQQHFPETIAYLDKKLSEPAENPNRTYEQGSSAGWTGH